MVNNEVTMTANGWEDKEWEKMQREMWSLLISKTRGEALAIVNRESWGTGMTAFQKVHYWFTKTSGQALTERMRVCMKPPPPKNEEDLMAHIARWKRELKERELMGAPVMDDQWKKIALQSMLVGNVKEKVEQKIDEDATYTGIMKEVEKFAERRRLEATSYKMKNGMEIDEVNQSEPTAPTNTPTEETKTT